LGNWWLHCQDKSCVNLLAGNNAIPLMITKHCLSAQLFHVKQKLTAALALHNIYYAPGSQ
jgi:tRNA1(Val) A37 N6-methylase TrmN6